jgi:CcmD family protein
MPEAPATAPAAPASPPAATATGQPPAPYESPQRAACQAELDRDARWRAELGREFETAFHEAEARRVTHNNRHVVLAYGALWVLTAGFLALMFLRQKKLLSEIARLEAEVAKAAAT